MKFTEKIRKIKGLKCNYNSGECRVLEVYDFNDTVLIKLAKGIEYSLKVDYMTLEFESDGSDNIVIPIKELERHNYHEDGL